MKILKVKIRVLVAWNNQANIFPDSVKIALITTLSIDRIWPGWVSQGFNMAKGWPGLEGDPTSQKGEQVRRVTLLATEPIFCLSCKQSAKFCKEV